MKIFKYELGVTDEQGFYLPVGAKVLSVQTQNGIPCMWVLVDETAPTEHRTFLTVGTGQPAPDDLGRRPYCGTYQLHGGALVFHVFENVTTTRRS